MANAIKLPSGNWRVRVFAGKDTNGKAKYKSFTANTERKANLAAMEWQEHYKEVLNDSSFMTVKEAIDSHITSLSNILSPATIAGYNRIKNNRMKDLINIKLSKLTNKKINESINKEAKTYSPKTLFNTYGLLKVVLNKYRPEFKCNFDLPKVYIQNRNVPLDDDLKKIYAYVYGSEMEIPILLACWLGLRVSEIRGLKMKNITETSINIDVAIVQGDDGAVIKSTKTKAGNRILPLPKYIKSRIDELITDNREYITALSGQAIYKRFMRVCKNVGIEQFRFHDLRHTNATIMLEENVPDKYIAERGGWGSDIYKKRYEHTTVHKTKFVNDKIDSRFEKIIDQSYDTKNDTND